MRKKRTPLSKEYNLYTVNPALAAEWHPSRNHPLTSYDVTPGSEKRVWWICSKGHEWQAVVNDRSHGTGCPYCKNKAVNNENCLQTVNPALAQQWHPTKNGNLTPRDVLPKSRKKVWWQCRAGHEWQAAILSRSAGTSCPYCMERLPSDDYCLASQNPSLVVEWHPSKNKPLTPWEVLPNSLKKVWWQCRAGHEWQATIVSRNNGSGCPYCANRKVCLDNCLATTNPDLASEWHPAKNGTMTPYDVTWGSKRKVWWLCHKGHEWQAVVNDRNKGTGCPYCAGKRKTQDAV